MPTKESAVAEINEKTRQAPSILELKPNVVVGSSHSHPPPPHYPQPHQGYQPLKFRPSVNIHEINAPNLSNHHRPGEHFVASKPEPFVPTAGYRPGTIHSVRKPEVITKIIKVPLTKVVTTPGLKHFQTYPKFINRNDYSTYFRNRVSQENQREASHRLVQNMYKRNSRNLVPRYAPGAGANSESL